MCVYIHMHRIQYTTVLGTSRRTDIHMETLQLPVNGSSPVKRAHSDVNLRHHFEDSYNGGSMHFSATPSPPPTFNTATMDMNNSQPAKRPGKHKMAKKFLHKMGLQRKKKSGGGPELDLSSSLDDRQLSWKNTNSDSGVSFASQQSHDLPLLSGTISRNGSLRTNSRCSEYSVTSSNAEPPVSVHSLSDSEQGKESYTGTGLPQQLSVPSVTRHSASMLMRMDEIDVVTGEDTSASPQRRRDPGTGNSLLRTREKEFGSQTSFVSYVAPPGHTFGVHIHLVEGVRLAVRDRGGTSDPYVKFRLGDQKYRSKTIMKDLNPKWDEAFTLWASSLQEPLKLKVYDYDRGMTDDFMGECDVDLTQLQPNHPTRMTLPLVDKSAVDEDLGHLVVQLEVTAQGMSPETLQMVQGISSKRSKGTRPVTVSKLRQWKSVLTVTLLKGISLPTLDVNDISTYCKFKVGSQRYKSKVLHKTANPEWKEQFDLRMYDGESSILHIEVWNRKIRNKDKFMGSCSVDPSKLSPEETHEMTLDLEEGEGQVHLLLTISGLSQHAWSEEVDGENSSIVSGPTQVDWEEVEKRYGLLNTHKAIKDVGFLQVKVVNATNLVSGRHGICDPVAVVEVGNTQVRTETLSRTNNPIWDKTFNFRVKDIHDTLDITVYSGDGSKGSEFVGMVTIPLLRLVDGSQTLSLKSKNCLEAAGKAELSIETRLVFNVLRASVRTVNPREAKVLQQPDKFNRKLLVSNARRLASLIRTIVTLVQFANGLFSWENRVHSALALVAFVWGCLFFDYWMAPAALIAVFIVEYCVVSAQTRRTKSQKHFVLGVECSESDESESEYDSDDSETGLLHTLKRAQEILVIVQNEVGFLADLGERVKNLFYWSVPFCSWLCVVGLLVAVGGLYLIPPRFLVLAWGLNKFSKKLLNPNYIPNNELMDLLSRLPTDRELAQWECPSSVSTKKKSKKKQS